MSNPGSTIGGVFKEFNELHAKIGGVDKEIIEGYALVGGAWKQIWSKGTKYYKFGSISGTTSLSRSQNYSYSSSFIIDSAQQHPFVLVDPTTVGGNYMVANNYLLGGYWNGSDYLSITYTNDNLLGYTNMIPLYVTNVDFRDITYYSLDVTNYYGVVTGEYEMGYNASDNCWYFPMEETTIYRFEKCAYRVNRDVTMEYHSSPTSNNIYYNGEYRIFEIDFDSVTFPTTWNGYYSAPFSATITGIYTPTTADEAKDVRQLNYYVNEANELYMRGETYNVGDTINDVTRIWVTNWTSSEPAVYDDYVTLYNFRYYYLKETETGTTIDSPTSYPYGFSLTYYRDDTGNQGYCYRNPTVIN